MEKNLSETELVSIGMPTYDKGLPYLKMAIDSVLNQTYSNLELVITDNSPTEETRSLCNEYMKRDSRVIYIENKKDLGTCDNYNEALIKSKGKYFCWVAFDDFLEKSFIEKCVTALKKDEESVMAMSDYVNILRATGKPQNIKTDPQKYIILERKPYLRLKKYILLPWGEGKATVIHGVWRRETIKDERIKDWDADVNFIFRGLSKGPFLLVNEPLFFKGILPDGESKENEPITLKRFFSSIIFRFSLVRIHYWNAKYILNISNLSIWDRSKLIFWEKIATIRMFLKRKL